MVALENENIFNELKDIIVKFVWDGRKPKIAYNKLILRYEQGGLKLCDLRTKNKAMKIAWIPKLLTDSQLAKLFEYFLPVPAKLLLQCNINPKHLKRFTIKNQFVKQLLYYWFELSYNVPKTKDQVLQQVIWFNSNTTLNNVWLNMPTAINAGIYTVANIFDVEQNRFLNTQEIMNTFHVKLNVLQLYKIIQSIPIYWKTMLRVNMISDDIFVMYYEYFSKQHKISKDYYWIQIDRGYVPPQGSKLLWEQDLECLLEDKEWGRIASRHNLITLCTKLRLFQYKITQHCLVTNRNLFWYKLRNDNLCTFCLAQSETLIHLFCECPKVCALWQHFMNYVKYTLNDNRLVLDKKKLLFNLYAAKPLDYINVMTLIFKRYIYVSRCEKLNGKNVSLNLNALIAMINKLRFTEKSIAIQNHKLDKHELKWNNFIAETTNTLQ